MSENLHLVFSIPSPSIASASNKEYHRWYRGHLTEILEASSWFAGRRYALDGVTGDNSPSEYPFLAAYEVGPDPAQNAAALTAALEARTSRAGYEPPPAWVAENQYASWNCIALEDGADISLPEHLYLVVTATPAGQSFDEYSAWYHDHLLENLNGPGFVRGWRFKMEPVGAVPTTSQRWSHLALYEVNGEIRSRLEELHEVRDTLGLKTDEWFADVPLIGIDAFAVSNRVDSTRWKRDGSTEWEATKASQAAENERVVKEFRDNKGRVGGNYKFPVVLLHNKGARSGVERISPLACLPFEGELAVFATSGGSPRPPDWYFNIVANPRTTVEFGTERYEVVARVTTGAERNRIWERQKAEYPHFAHMDEVTTREIPVILLERIETSSPGSRA